MADGRDDLAGGLRRAGGRRHRAPPAQDLVPRTVAIVQAMRALIISPLGEFPIKRRARTMVPALEAEVQQLGRYWGASSAGLGAPREKAAVED